MKATYGIDQVDKALAGVEKRAKESLRKINREAGRLLSNGDYAGMEALVQVARAVQGFQPDLGVMRAKWRELTRTGKPTNKVKEETTPLWSYYQPILRIVTELGGDATRDRIEQAYEERLRELAEAGDREIMANGLPRWKVMIRRAQGPMIKEGFLDAGRKGRWVITALGRQAAQSKCLEPAEKAGSSL